MNTDIVEAARTRRPLPRTVRPVHNETLASFLRRLAAANRLDPEALRIFATGDRRKATAINAETLAVLSGQPARVLRLALPELTHAGPGEPHPHCPARHRLVVRACSHCAAHRAGAEQVWRYAHYEDIICIRHKRWLTTRYTCGTNSVSLASQPGILAANTRHRRLIRRHGPAAADTAYRNATDICQRWHDRQDHTERYHYYMGIFHPGNRTVSSLDPSIGASLYPQTVALTRLLASPYWHSLPTQSSHAKHAFIREVRATVAPNYRWKTQSYYGTRDPLVEYYLHRDTAST